MKQQDPNFRKDDIERLIQLARSAESASIIGVSGVGKSNLFHHLLDPAIQQHYLKTDYANHYIFVKVNFHYAPDFEDRSIYSIILEQLEDLEAQNDRFQYSDKDFQAIRDHHNKLIDAGDDLLKVQRHFKLAVRILMRRPEQKLVLVFDQFDDLYRHARATLFSALRGLRETYKYRLCYFLFTRNPLISMADNDDLHRDEFYELVSAHILGLKPYKLDDSRRLLHRVAKRKGWVIGDDGLVRLYHNLTGGHAGLLRASFIAAFEDENIQVSRTKSTNANADKLLENQNVKSECRKLHDGLPMQESQMLELQTYHNAGRMNLAVNYLKLRGILTSAEHGRLRVFSPIFRRYLESLHNDDTQTLRVNTERRTIWIANREVGPITQTDFRVFLELYNNMDDLVTYEQLGRAGWPSQSLETARRLVDNAAKRLNDALGTPLIQKVGQQGYRLER